MATKQELQQSIKKMVDGANNPKVSEVIRKSLLKSIEKAEKQLKELEKAETLEKKEEELTEKQEQKVEAVKEESKKLVQSLKGKIKTAKSSGAKTKKSTPPSSKLMQKAKELARKYRTAQKGVPTGDFDIERDAGRPAMPKGKRIAKKSGKTYYENRENRIDRKQPPKTYPKLADGGMMAKGGIYSSDDVWIVTFQNQDSGELEKISVRANNKKNAIAIAEDESGLSGDWQYYSADKKMASGGMMAKGGEFEVGDMVELKSGQKAKVIRVEESWIGVQTSNNMLKDVYKEDVKKLADGGMMANGGYVVVNLGGDRYDGGVAYQIMKGDKIVKEGLIDGDHGVEFEGKKYDGLKSLADGIGAKLVTQKMAKGGKTEPEETVYIEYFNKAKKFAKDRKEFKGQNAYSEAISWGRKNIPNFNADMVKFKMASGGEMAKGGKVKEIEFDGTKWYLTYDDPTHFFLSNSPDFKGNPYHIGQFKSRPFYNEVNEWLKETSRNSKMEYGGILQPMTGGVNADPRFDIYDTGAFMKKGGAVKRAMRFEDGGMNVGGDNEYLIMYRSDNPTYQNEDGFEGNPPDSMYADSPFDVLDYLRDNMPDDVELISIEEASDVYKKGGSLQSIKNKYEENEDENAHSENVVLLAKHFGTKEELAEAKKILSIHNKEGHLSTENGQKRRELHLKLIEKAREQMSKEGIEFEYGGILQPMTGGVNADPRFDIYSPDFMAKGGEIVFQTPYMGESKFKHRGKILQDKGEYVVVEVENDPFLFNGRKGVMEVKKEMLMSYMANGGYMNDGGLVKVKWSDAEYGDSARVIAENKMGLILKPYGQKFHLKFPDGTEKTYTANELEFYKEESYKKGGKTNEQSENLQMLKNQSKEFGHHAKELQTALKSNPKVDAWVVAKSERASTDLSDITHYLDGMKNTMAMGGVTEHGLKEGDEIVVAHDNIIVVLNKKTGESAFINIETGKREDATHLKDKLMMMSTMENGGKVSLEKMYDKFREQAMAVRLKIATLIGIDTASEYLNRDLVVNPFSLIESAVRKGFITIDEINNNVWDAAVSESNSIEESYRDSGEGIGSSDMNAFISSMLNDAGIKVGVKDNTYQRMAKGGEVKVGDKVKSKSGVEGEVYDTTGMFFKLKDKFGNKNPKLYSVRDFKPSEIKSMAKGGKVKFRVSEIEERKDGNLNVIEDGKKYVVAYSSDGYKNPYGISFEGEDTFRFLSKDAKAKKVYLKLKPKIEEYWSKKMAKGGATEMLYSMTVYFEQKQSSGGYGINKIFTSVRAKNETEAISKAKKSVKNSYRGGMPIKNMSVLYPIKKEEITYRNGGETKGSQVKFADKVASIKKSLLERKKVPKAVQKDYGKTFSPAEAEDSAKRIVGAKTYAERIKYLAKKNKK